MTSAKVADATSIMLEIGTSGLKHSAGYVLEEYHRDLVGKKAAQKYREMGDNEPLIGAVLAITELSGRRVKYSIDTARDENGDARTDEAAEKAQALVETAFGDIENGIGGLVGWAAANVVQYGYALCEPVYKLRLGDTDNKQTRSKHRDGLLGWRKFASRRQESIERWDFAGDGDWVGAYQIAAPHYHQVYLPRGRMLHFRLFDANGNPEGKSMLRYAYEPYRYKRNHQFIEAVGAERNLAGFPKATMPAEAYARAVSDPSSAEAVILNNLKNIVRRIKTDTMTGLVTPGEDDENGKTGYSFGLISSGGRALVESDTIIRRFRAEIALALHAQFVLVGQDSVGAYSLIKGQSDAYAESLGGLFDMALSVINDVAIPQLLTINAMNTGDAPRVSRGAVQSVDIAALAQLLGTVVGAGIVTPDNTLEAAVREAAELPPIDSGTERAREEPSAMDIDAILGGG